MNPAADVLRAVANELATQARKSLPELRPGEQIRCEWLDKGMLYRETTFGGETILCRYDFQQRKCYRRVKGERGVWQLLT